MIRTAGSDWVMIATSIFPSPSKSALDKMLVPAVGDTWMKDGLEKTGVAHGANGNTSTESFAGLLAGTGSASFLVTVAVAFTNSDNDGVTTTETLVCVPLVRFPTGHVTVPAANTQPGVLLACTKATLAGSVCE